MDRRHKRNDETKSPMLSKVIEDYVEDISSLWDERHKKVNGIDLVPKLGLFLEVVGNKPIDTVTLEDVSRFKSLVSRYPSNKNKRPQYRIIFARCPEGGPIIHHIYWQIFSTHHLIP